MIKTKKEWIDEIEPITLTPEILEKIGMARSGSYYINTESDYYELLAYEINDGTWHINYHCTEFSDIPDQSINVFYVHQIQNFFRLCGIEKEIKL